MILLVLSALSMTMCAGICYRLWRLYDHGDQSGAHFGYERPTIRPRGNEAHGWSWPPLRRICRDHGDRVRVQPPLF
jgi:hypothetical protein